MSSLIKEPFNGFSHLLGMILSAAGLAVLIHRAVTGGTVWSVVSFAVFGASLVLLYLASSMYHLLPLSIRGTRILKRLDHMMIYFLIFGTYVPICLIALRGTWGWGLLSGITVFMIGGIIMKAFWIDAPRWLSTALYGVMGWILLVAIFPLVRVLPVNGIIWLLAGGAAYTVGALIYGFKWPNISRKFGFHELWHLFVMAGSFSHFWFIFRYVSVLDMH